MKPNTQPSPLKVTIVGAGIGGLATALGLRMQGHNVQVFEKSKFGNEVGAAIVLPANVYGLLKKFGINPEEHGSNTEDIRSFYTLKGDLMFENDLTGHGGAARLIHRVDLHESLKEAAVASGVEIHLAHPVKSIDPERGTVTLSSGQSFTADAVIGADGVKSTVRTIVVPDAPSPEPFHISMFRMLIPCSKLASLQETSRFINPPGKMTIFMSEDGRRTVSYPCRSNTVMNVAACFPTCYSRAYKDDMEINKHMLDIFSDFHTSAKTLLESADEVSVWPLYDLPALGNWSNGRATLVGDAAHPLLPYAAQGGAQALEDAATLAVLLGRGTSAEEVPKLFQSYFDVRHGRVDWVQEFARDADQSSPQNPGIRPKLNPVEFFNTVHDYDAWAVAEEKLRRHE
jgi:2-polyprenyl-6-methoxyphenol hydroxylase-like FAD-dependent oxidoreductase